MKQRIALSLMSEIIEPLTNKGWQCCLWVGDEVVLDRIIGGDPNCPCAKEYDPTDGHGFTMIHQDDAPDELDDASAMDVARWMVLKAKSLEGKPRNLTNSSKRS